MRASLLLAALTLLAACTGGGGSTPPTPDTFRVVLIADTHVVPPDWHYHAGAGNEVDNVSLLRAEQRLLEVQQRVNRLDPQPEAVFALGDLVTEAFETHSDLEGFLGSENAFSITANLFNGFRAPVYVLFGNHDYERDCDAPDDHAHDLAHEVFDHYYGADPYYAVDIHGFRFLALNGQLGGNWLASDERAGTGGTIEGWYGQEQLDWPAAQLDEGRPTIVLSHYMSLIWARNEAPEPNTDLATVLFDHGLDNVRGLFAGHTHRWIELSGLTFPDIVPGQGFGAPEWVIGATRYDPDNFWVLELDNTTGQMEILDFAKHMEGRTCADAVDPASLEILEAAPETGDCVGIADFDFLGDD